MNKYIFVPKIELKSFKYESNRDNQIRKFWAKILHETPKPLIKEIKSNPTNLVKQDPKEFSITGVEPYRFVTKNASKKLASYLKKHIIFVEKETDDAREWRYRIKDILEGRGFGIEDDEY